MEEQGDNMEDNERTWKNRGDNERTGRTFDRHKK